MSTKLFYKSNDRLYITSYRRANIRTLAEHCIRDIKKLSTYIHKIVQFRLFTIKYLLVYILASKQRCLLYSSKIHVLFMRYFIFSIGLGSTTFSSFYASQ